MDTDNSAVICEMGGRGRVYREISSDREKKYF